MGQYGPVWALEEREKFRKKRTIFCFQTCFYQKPSFLSFSTQNHVESFMNLINKSVLDPKRARLNQNSDFGHVRTYSWLHKSRNTQGKIHGTYLGNIYIYGIYKECITNISIDTYDITMNIHEYIHQTHRHRLRRRPPKAVYTPTIYRPWHLMPPA